MNQQKTPPEVHNISHSYVVIPPGEEDAHIVPASDWEHIKKKTSKISTRSSVFHTIGSVLLGTAASAGLALLTLPPVLASETRGDTYTVLVAVFLTALTCGGLSLGLSHARKNDAQHGTAEVVEEMERLEERWSAKKTNTDLN